MKSFSSLVSPFGISPAGRALAGVLAMAAFALAGCGRGAQPLPARPDSTAGGKAPRITVIGGGSQRYWNAAHQGAVDAGKEFGVEIQWKTPTAKDVVPQQVRFVEKAISDNVSGIVVAPLEPTELAPHINKSGKNRIPAATFALPAHTKFILTAVATDYYQAGVLAARRAATVSGGQGALGVLALPDNAPAVESVRGFKETLRKEFPSAEVREVAGTNAGALSVLFIPEEDRALAALQTRASQPKLLAIGADQKLWAALESGAVDALIVPDYKRMSYESVRAIVQFRAHEPPPKRIMVAPHLVTKESLTTPRSRQLLGLNN